MLEEIFPQSLWVGANLALAHYNMRDLDAAQETFESVREADPHRMEYIDTYSNILYVKERRAELSHLAHMSAKVNKFLPETCCIIGNYYSLKGQHERAISYFQRCLRTNSRFLSAWTLMGHEYVELKNTSAAVSSYRRAIAVSASDYRAWYGLGQTYEMLHLYQYALHYFRKATALRPSDPRMWCAVGNCLCKLGLTSDAILAYERAVGSRDHEGIAVKELARLHRACGNTSDAATYFVHFLVGSGLSLPPFLSPDTIAERQHQRGGRDDHGGPVVGMGLGFEFGIDASQKGLDHAQAFAMDPDRAEAALFLAHFYNRRSYTESHALQAAEYYGTLLLDFNGPESDEARALLRELRERRSDGAVAVRERGVHRSGREPSSPRSTMPLGATDGGLGGRSRDYDSHGDAGKQTAVHVLLNHRFITASFPP